jgi:hypothetical protein
MTSSSNEPTQPGRDEDLFVLNYDCGDGVPALSTLPREEEEIRVVAPDTGLPNLSPRTFGLAATIIGQLLIAVAVLAGANPIVAGAAALSLLLCGLALVAVHVLDEQDKTDGLG